MSIIAAIALGIVVDDTVDFIAKYQKLQKKRLSVEEAIYGTLNEKGTTIVFSTIIIVSGFSIFTISAFKTNQYFGFYTSISVAFALIADLFLLPSI